MPKCTSSNQLSAKFVSPNGAGGWFYFLIAFTNEGSTACSESGVPIAQPVQCSAKAPVGPVATYYPTDGVERQTVVLHAHGGRAYVEYYIINEANLRKSWCRPTAANGVEFKVVGGGRFYIPITRWGATEVCTKNSDTRVGAFSARIY